MATADVLNELRSHLFELAQAEADARRHASVTFEDVERAVRRVDASAMRQALGGDADKVRHASNRPRESRGAVRFSIAFQAVLWVGMGVGFFSRRAGFSEASAAAIGFLGLTAFLAVCCVALRAFNTAAIAGACVGFVGLVASVFLDNWFLLAFVPLGGGLAVGRRWFDVRGLALPEARRVALLARVMLPGIFLLLSLVEVLAAWLTFQSCPEWIEGVESFCDPTPQAAGTMLLVPTLAIAALVAAWVARGDHVLGIGAAMALVGSVQLYERLETVVWGPTLLFGFILGGLGIGLLEARAGLQFLETLAATPPESQQAP